MTELTALEHAARYLERNNYPESAREVRAAAAALVALRGEEAPRATRRITIDEYTHRDADRYRALRARLDNGPAWFDTSGPYTNLRTWPPGLGGDTLDPRVLFTAPNLDALADRTVDEWEAGPPHWWPTRASARPPEEGLHVRYVEGIRQEAPSPSGPWTTVAALLAALLLLVGCATSVMDHSPAPGGRTRLETSADPARMSEAAAKEEALAMARQDCLERGQELELDHVHTGGWWDSSWRVVIYYRCQDALVADR